MSKHASRHVRDAWPTWKILTVAIAAAILGTAFLVAYGALPQPQTPAGASQPAPAKAPASAPDDPASPLVNIGLGNLLFLMGLVGWGAALTFGGWLGYRMYLRIPAWKRRQMFGRGR